jgi:sugar phosphate isomerase/epimerase
LRIGCCAGLEQIAVVEKAGYDYIEPPVGAVRAERPESEFKDVLALVESRSIRPEAWNCLIPADLKLTGPSVDFYRIERYLRTAFERIARLGGEIVVFGSGSARNLPEGFSQTEGRRQILEFLSLCGNIASQHSLTIAIEPLNRKESNVINTVAEAVEFAEIAAKPQIQVLADLYHMDEEAEPLSDVAAAGSFLRHCHTADTGRCAPGSGAYDHIGFFRAMKEAGYNDRVSVECRWDNFENELLPTLQFLRCVADQVETE